MKEIVSIVIPNYNRSKILENTITSVLRQTYRNIEIIIVDDGSTDGSQKLIKKLASQHVNIRYKLLEENRGANYCRNLGVGMSRGNYIAFLDSDDTFFENKIELQMKTFGSSLGEEIGIVFTNYLVNNKRNNFLRGNKFVNIKDVMLRNRFGGFSTIMIKKEVFIECGGLDDNLPSCQDWDLYIRVLENHKGYYLYKPLVNYHLQPDSISQNYSKVIDGHGMIFEKITKLNNVKRFYSQKKLESEQAQHVGDLYRKFKVNSSARRKYLYSLKISFNVTTLLKMILTH